MKDRCKADADTLVPIPGADHTFVPPDGWEYAMLEEASVTQVSDEGPVLALASIVTDKVLYKATAQRTAMVKSLAELVGIDPPSKVSFNRPNKRKLSGLTMTLWENEAKRGDAKGALLLLSTSIGDKEIFGIGYAPAGDLEGTKAILATLETFKLVEAAEEGDDEKSTDDGSEKKK